MTISTATPTTDQKRDNFARNVLRANGLFSVTSGLLLLLGAMQAASWLGLDGSMAPLILHGVGAGVLGFAAYVWWSASRKPVTKRDLTIIAALDAVWVVLSYGLVFTGWLGLSQTGNWLVMAVADIVLVLGVLEFYALHRLKSA